MISSVTTKLIRWLPAGIHWLPSCQRLRRAVGILIGGGGQSEPLPTVVLVPIVGGGLVTQVHPSAGGDIVVVGDVSAGKFAAPGRYRDGVGPQRWYGPVTSVTIGNGDYWGPSVVTGLVVTSGGLVTISIRILAMGGGWGSVTSYRY